MNRLSERLFHILSSSDFLAMKGQANEVPIFIQTYESPQEDAARRVVENLAARLGNIGIVVKVLDLFDLVLEELEEHRVLKDLLRDERDFERVIRFLNREQVCRWVDGDYRSICGGFNSNGLAAARIAHYVVYLVVACP